jgi:hypothetical protein
MNWQHPDGGRGRKGHFLPSLEALEDRSLLAVNFSVSGSTLFISSPTTTSQRTGNITITDNGSQNPNNVVAFSDVAGFFPAVPITNVVIKLANGNLNINYNLTGPETGNRVVFADLGRGRVNFEALLNGDIQAGGSMRFAVIGTPPHKRNDSIVGVLNGNLQTNAQLTWNTAAVQGNNTLLGFGMAGNVASGAILTVDQLGGIGPNQITTTYTGVMNGVTSLLEAGGQSNDSLFADLEFLSGSTGTLVPSALLGNAGNDDLTYIVHNPSHTAVIFNQLIDGGSGINIAHRTPNVIVTNVAEDFVLP